MTEGLSSSRAIAEFRTWAMKLSSWASGILQNLVQLWFSHFADFLLWHQKLSSCWRLTFLPDRKSSFPEILSHILRWSDIQNWDLLTAGQMSKYSHLLGCRVCLKIGFTANIRMRSLLCLMWKTFSRWVLACLFSSLPIDKRNCGATYSCVWLCSI